MSKQPITIIPAIDLMNGEAVRLSQGDFDKKTIYSKDPLELAKRFAGAGIQRLHLVDLDGARAGKISNLHVLERIASHVKMDIDFGGGITSRDNLKDVFDSGARMAAVGSVAVKNPELFQTWVQEFGGEAFFLGADVLNGLMAVKGWTEITELRIEDFLEGQLNKGIRQVFCTDISKDGMLEGPSIDLYTRLIQQFPHLQLVASGGVSKLDDIYQLQEIGCFGVIIGKAIYENRIDLEDLTPFLKN